MSANTLQALAEIKRFETTSEIISNEPLLAAEHNNTVPNTREPADALPRQTPRYYINGVPAYRTLEGVIEDGVIWAVHDRFSFVVVRQDYELIVSPWPMFANDMLLLRFVFRVGFGWPKPESLVQIVGTLPDFDGS